MKIFLIDINYSDTSTGKLLEALYNSYTLKGHDVSVYYGRGRKSRYPNITRISNSLFTFINILYTRISGSTNVLIKRPTYYLINEISKLKPDVIHLHDLHGYYLDIILLIKFLKLKKIAVVWTFHCDFMFTGRCGFSLDCDKWLDGCKKCNYLLRYPGTWYIDKASQMYIEKNDMFKDFYNLKIVSPSLWLQNRINISPMNIKCKEVVNNGINLDIYKPTINLEFINSLGIGNKDILLSIGEDIFSDRKGGKFILKLAEKFINDKNIHFLIVGVNKIPKNIPPNVTILSRISDQSLLSTLYTISKFLILTSKVESFSMVSAESLACGLPIIGFNSGAPTEVAPKGYGLFVEYGDIDALEHAIRLNLSPLRTLFSRDICINFARKYSIDNMANSYLKIYNNFQ